MYKLTPHYVEKRRVVGVLSPQNSGFIRAARTGKPAYQKNQSESSESSELCERLLDDAVRLGPTMRATIGRESLNPLLLLVFACAEWGPVLRAPLEYRGFSVGTEWPVAKFGSSEIHRCTVGFPQTIS